MMNSQLALAGVETFRNRVTWTDALTLLNSLPDESVHCMITSPPYFGLRDYGTARWKGGDPDCDHVADASKTKKQGNPEFNKNRPSRENTIVAGYYSDVCPKCGATKEDGQIGLEETPEQFITKLVVIFREAHRVLRSDGTLWLNLGDSYNGSGKGMDTSGLQRTNSGANIDRPTRIRNLAPKNLLGIPWRVALALQADGWILRSDIIWHKPAPMPESVKDRPTKAHEYVFMFAKSGKYFYDQDAVREQFSDERMGNPGPFKSKYTTKPADGRTITPRGGGSINLNLQNEGWNSDGKISGRNKRTVWTVNSEPYSEAHFATYPPALIEPMIKAGCPRDVCSVCGAGHVRVVNRTSLERYELPKDDPRYRPSRYEGKYDAIRGNGANGMRYQVSATLGFEPSCNCDSDKSRGIVLDMFGGAGTTGLVARRLGRDYITCDLNPEYVAMAQKRIDQEDPTKPLLLKTGEKQLSLFDAVEAVL